MELTECHNLLLGVESVALRQFVLVGMPVKLKFQVKQKQKQKRNQKLRLNSSFWENS
jgi:hypothetical protein